MHYELLVEYDRAKLFIPAAHSGRMIEGLAALLGDLGGDAKGQAAEIMAALGSRFQREGLHVSAERMFRHALAIQDTDPGALIGLANGLERAGNYKATASVLGTLVKAHPESSEGQLRLAINLARTDHRGAAREHFKLCTAESNPDWVRAIAYQEQARELLDNDKLEAATALLRKAIASVPADFHLRVQLVAALDRQHLFLEASRMVEEIRRLQSSREPSARLRYAEWPSLSLEDTLDGFHVMDPAAVAALKARVAADAGEAQR
jgi:tetratricopeptide (TPR) repeat protein